MAEVCLMNYRDELMNYVVHGEFTERMNPDNFKKTVREQLQHAAEETPINDDDKIEHWCHHILESVADSLGFASGDLSLIRKFYMRHCADSTYIIDDFEPMDAMCLLIGICDNDFDIENIVDDLCEPLVNMAVAVIENDEMNQTN